jgi:ribosome biogenesis GTPase
MNETHVPTDIREDGKGCHTTTRRDLISLPNGGIVIDTPGIRSMEVESVDLSKSFSNIDALAATCRFSDCTHKRAWMRCSASNRRRRNLAAAVG